MTTALSDYGLIIANNVAAYQLSDISASIASNAITVTLEPCTLSFRNTTLTLGTPSNVVSTLPAVLTISATDSFGLATASGKQRLAILAINAAGVMYLAASSIAGGLTLDETGLITTSTTATTSTAFKTTGGPYGSVAYRVVGFIDATFTTAVGWGSLALVQGGQGLAASVDALRDVSSNSQAASYTLALTDRGRSIDFTGSTAQTITIPANASVAFPLGTVITVTNTTANSLSIAITTDTLRQGGTANVGTRTLGQYGVATMRKIAATVWIISGAGIT